MEEYYWDTRIEYLTKSRTVWFNHDFIEFLIKTVWRIKSPVNIADFGCGNGFLGSVFMPLLPNGSTYTGYDKGEKLIENAKAVFSESPYKTDFHQCDLLHEEVLRKYDIVICQALLMHISGPERMLAKMIDAAGSGGLVICIEPNWNVTNAALHIEGLDLAGQCNLGLLQKLWKKEREEEKTDKCIGTKIPFMMQKLGLKDISIRMNDCINFINPHADEAEYEKQRNTFLADGWGREMGNKDEFVQNLSKRGVTADEAGFQYDCEKEMNEFVQKNHQNISALSVPPSFISYGRKKLYNPS